MTALETRNAAEIEDDYEDDLDGPDGQETLLYAMGYLMYFCHWPNQATLDTVTLWAAHTHAKDKNGMLVFPASPRPLWQSGEPGSGKTHGMRTTSRICSTPYMFTEPSEPAVAHAIGEHATLFLDEIDVLFGPTGGRKAAIRAIINDGYTPDGEWARIRNGQLMRLSTFGALGMAGLDVVSSGAAGEKMRATLTRCIRIRMKRAPDGYQAPMFDNEARVVTMKIRNSLAEYIGRNIEEIAAQRPKMPNGIGNREAELWWPLLAIADVVGGRWPKAARKACVRMSSSGLTPADSAEALADVDAVMSTKPAWGDIMRGLAGIELPAEAPEPRSEAPAPRRPAASATELVRDALRESDGSLSGPELAEITKCTPGAVRVALTRLANRGEIEQGTDRNDRPQRGRWQAVRSKPAPGRSKVRQEARDERGYAGAVPSRDLREAAQEESRELRGQFGSTKARTSEADSLRAAARRNARG